MVVIDRRNAMGLGLAGAAALWSSRSAQALTESLSDIGASLSPAPQATIYTAREIVTLDTAKPAGEAVAVINGRILWVGNLDEVVGVLGD